MEFRLSPAMPLSVLLCGQAPIWSCLSAGRHDATGKRLPDQTEWQGRVLGDPVSEVTMHGEKVARSLGEPDSGAESGSELRVEDRPIVADFLLANGVEMEIGGPGRYFLRLQVNDETLAATSFVVVSPGREADHPLVELEIIERGNAFLPPRLSQGPD